MTKDFERGLTQDYINKKDELIKQLQLRLSYVQFAIEKYNELIDEAKGFINEMGEKAETYYLKRSPEWLETYRGKDYENFMEKWKSFELEEIDLSPFEDQLDEFDDLPNSPD